jgi:hypothetical protein
LLNLLLTVAVIRRLRQHGERLAAYVLPASVDPPGPAIGASIGDFSAVTTDGSVLSRAEVAGATIGFFTPDCEPCQRLVPRFVAHAAATPDERDRTVAVVVGRAVDCEPTVRALTPVARVVVEEAGIGPLQAAFGVGGFPLVVRVAADLTVLDSGADVVAMDLAGRP